MENSIAPMEVASHAFFGVDKTDSGNKDCYANQAIGS